MVKYIFIKLLYHFLPCLQTHRCAALHSHKQPFPLLNLSGTIFVNNPLSESSTVTKLLFQLLWYFDALLSLMLLISSLPRTLKVLCDVIKPVASLITAQDFKGLMVEYGINFLLQIGWKQVDVYGKHSCIFGRPLTFSSEGVIFPRVQSCVLIRKISNIFL